MSASILILLVSLSAPPAETPIDDATVATWMKDFDSADSVKHRAAMEKLIKAGPKAKSVVPELVKMIEPKHLRRYEAMEVLGAIGPDAKDAVPGLLAIIPKDGDSFGYSVERAAYALARIDGAKIEATRALLLSKGKGIPILLTISGTLSEYPAQVVPHLVTLCADKDAKVRAHAAEVLSTLKQKPFTKVPTPTLYEKAGDGTKGIPAALEKLLKDENTEVRLAGAKAITHVAPELADKTLEVVVAMAVEWAKTITKTELYAHEVFQPVPEKSAKVLIPLFDHENDRLRWWAINHLSYLPIREPIEDVLKNGKTARAREAAAITLGSRYTGGAQSVPGLKAALADQEFIVRFAAAKSLVQIDRASGKDRVAGVPVLIEGLQQKEEKVRLEASQNLLQIGSDAKDAIPTLKKLLDDKKPEVQLEAALALVGIDKKEANGTVPALVGGLKMGDSPATRAAKALAELGPVAKDAVPELVKHFDAKNVHLRLHSASASARIDPTQAPKAVEVLVGLLKDKKHKSSMVRSYALVALQKIGPPAKDALPALAELLKDDGPFHADAAIAMIAIDPEGKAAFEWIRTALADKNNDEDAYDLSERLPELGAKAKPLIPDLVKLLPAKTPFLREMAIETLGAIGPDAKDALPELKKLAAEEKRENLRTLAAEAIKKIEAK